VKRWTAVINHSRASGKPPQTAEFDWYGDLRPYVKPDSEVVAIAIYRNAACRREPPQRSAPAPLTDTVPQNKGLQLPP
jgi:hypothetical protein